MDGKGYGSADGQSVQEFHRSGDTTRNCCVFDGYLYAADIGYGQFEAALKIDSNAITTQTRISNRILIDIALDRVVDGLNRVIQRVVLTRRKYFYFFGFDAVSSAYNKSMVMKLTA